MNTEAQKAIFKKLQTEGETSNLDLETIISIIKEVESFEKAVDRLKVIRREKQSKVRSNTN